LHRKKPEPERNWEEGSEEGARVGWNLKVPDRDPGIEGGGGRGGEEGEEKSTS